MSRDAVMRVLVLLVAVLLFAWKVAETLSAVPVRTATLVVTLPLRMAESLCSSGWSHCTRCSKDGVDGRGVPVGL